MFLAITFSNILCWINVESSLSLVWKQAEINAFPFLFESLMCWNYIESHLWRQNWKCVLLASAQHSRHFSGSAFQRVPTKSKAYQNSKRTWLNQPWSTQKLNLWLVPHLGFLIQRCAGPNLNAITLMSDAHWHSTNFAALVKLFTDHSHHLEHA